MSKLTDEQCALIEAAAKAAVPAILKRVEDGFSVTDASPAHMDSQ